MHYFHELSDPYSHLAVQKLDALRERYRLSFEVHLVSAAQAEYRGDANRYPTWALNDAMSIAAGYGVEFPADALLPSEAQVRSAENALSARCNTADFATHAIQIGTQLWAGEIEGASTDTPREVLEGDRLRQRLGHYAGGMFYFEGEWYWGLDRLYHMEARLIEEGFGQPPLLVPRPRCAAEPIEAADVTLEYFPSLRSPYTAISFERTMRLADRTGVNLVIRPVMPMMMRGVPAPTAKGSYIIADAAREGRAAGDGFGRIVDPFGGPVRQAFSLLPFMQEHGRVRDFIDGYLRAAWKAGIDITAERGLASVVRNMGLDWQAARDSMNNAVWEQMLEANVNDMLDAGLWGVPSFRVTGGADTTPFACWGQDRLWRVDREIRDRA